MFSPALQLLLEDNNSHHFLNFQVDQAFALAPIDPTGNIDYKSLCYIITHGDEKEES